MFGVSRKESIYCGNCHREKAKEYYTDYYVHFYAHYYSKYMTYYYGNYYAEYGFAPLRLRPAVPSPSAALTHSCAVVLCSIFVNDYWDEGGKDALHPWDMRDGPPPASVKF